MREEREVAEDLRIAFAQAEGISDQPEYRDYEAEGLPESESGFTLTLQDGTKFLVQVTKIEEGDE